MNELSLCQPIEKFHNQCQPGQDGRHRSWENCYKFFRDHRTNLQQVEDTAALHLGFYLASWGMYRGSSFLLQRSHTAHKPAIRALASPQFSILWQHDVGRSTADVRLAATIMDLVDSVKTAYRKLAPPSRKFEPSGTLITKVMLGTIGCLPACDRFFVKGFRERKFKYSGLNRRFVDQTLQFCIEHRLVLADLQSKFSHSGGPQYPLMKLVDMHFWQTGKDTEQDGGVAIEAP